MEPENVESAREAAELAARIGAKGTQEPDFILKVGTGGLSLTDNASGLVLRLDFTAKPLSRRMKEGWRREALMRAVGRKPGKTPTVLDATGGLGRDAFILAGHGCPVILCEKNPVLFAMLEEALDRAGRCRTTAAAAARISPRQGDSIAIMAALPETERPDVVYLDPMYPERGKKALARKEMQILKHLCGRNGAEEQKLLAAALACAAERVVVKRPKTAPALSGPAPDTAVRGRAHRFDIYLVA